MPATIRDYFFEIVKRRFACSDVSEFLRGGCNGPYRDPETPVRIVAHWLVAAALAKEVLIEELEIQRIHELIDYLLSSGARPMDATFHCRYNREKDFCNGLMGQAWALEALIAAGNSYSRKDALSLARRVFYLHPYLEHQGIWRRVAVDGSYLATDYTFNHQLWFAAMGAQLDDVEASKRSLRFLDKVGQNVQLYNNGVIFHKSSLGKLALKDVMSASGVKELLYRSGQRLKGRGSLYSKSVGYHAFNMYAFALLKRAFPSHSFWISKKFHKMIEVTKNQDFVRALDSSAYGWPYNPPGIELAFVGEVFGLGREYCETWIARQVNRTFNRESGDLLTFGVPDPVTSAARIYELGRLAGEYDITGFELCNQTRNLFQ